MRLKFQVGEFEGHINTLKGLDKQCFEENNNLDTDFTRNVTDNATMNARINELQSQIRIKSELIMGLNAQLSRESAQSNHLHEANQKIQYDVDHFRSDMHLVEGKHDMLKARLERYLTPPPQVDYQPVVVREEKVEIPY